MAAYSLTHAQAGKSGEINTRWLSGAYCTPPQQLLFVDDDFNNIVDVSENCPRQVVQALEVDNPRAGIMRRECDYVMQWVAAAAGGGAR